MEKELRYFVSKDLQGGDFGMYRLFTIEEWREQAKEWADLDDSGAVYDHLCELPKEDVMDFIADFWELEFRETTFTKEDIRQALSRYNELCKKVASCTKTLEELCEELNGYNLEDFLFDCNYFEITATITNINGKLSVHSRIDIWDSESGECLEDITICELEEFV